MAAVYLHNALYVRNPPQTENSFVHSRNLSTISNTTFFTTATLRSQPNEPLLHTATSQTANFDDQLSHIPRNRDETIRHLPCEDPLIDDNPMSEAEKEDYWARNCPRPLKQWKWLKLGLQATLAVWAIYNIVRYFIAFADFGDSTNQTFCLALGSSAGVSFSLTFISFLLVIRDRNGLIHNGTPSYLLYVRLTLDYLSSFCLLGPAVVNFALIFIWKHSVDPHFHLGNRCHIDIDVVWSVSNTLCNNKSPDWAIWLTLSVLRLALTLVVIVAYHITSSLYYGQRRRGATRGFRAQTSGSSTPEEPVPFSLNLPLHRELHQPSDSTLCGIATGEPSPQNQIHLTRSHSSNLSQDISPPEPITLGRSTIAELENEHNRNGFVDDHFRLMVSQISQETDAALDLAHSPSPENMSDIPMGDVPPTYEDGFDDTRSHNNRNNIFNLPPVLPVLGYNEFGLPYPPDQHVRVLNGYVRRMPTIESMGTGEAGSSIGASSNRAVESILTSSRPPTRNTLLSRNSTDHDAFSSEPPSRTNSLSARVELLVGLPSTSEHGELLGRASPVARLLSTPISYVDHAPSDTHSSATGGSRGTSYHTCATSESFLPPGLITDRQPHSPVWGQQETTSDSELQQPP